MQTISRERFGELMDRYPEIPYAVIKILAERVRISSELCCVRTARDRVTVLVHQLAQRYGSATPGGSIEIIPPLFREEFATWAGVSRR